jgi:hypothetical protein
MKKTEQQKRFETAWHIKWPNDEPHIFSQDTKGQYEWREVQDTFEGWQLCEASALRLCSRTMSRSENWVLVAELFSTGSNSARQICIDAGIDPDAKTVTRKPTSLEVKPAKCVCCLHPDNTPICKSFAGTIDGTWCDNAVRGGAGSGVCGHNRACHGGENERS